MNLKVFDSDAILNALDLPSLIDALEGAFRAGSSTPPRSHFDTGSGAFLVMPAWEAGAFTGAKLVTIHRENHTLGLATIHGLYVLFDGVNGVPLAVMDGRVLTLLRTAAASALAARYLAPAAARNHLVIGAGALAPYLVRSMRCVRPIESVRVWNRTKSRATKMASDLTAEGIPACSTDDLLEAVAWADIISTATQSTTPLVRSDELGPGTHLDLVGAYTPEMAEASPEVLESATVVVDTWEGARKEGGDLIRAVAEGTMTWDDVAGDLTALTRGAIPGRSSVREITVFKSVGASLEDLVAARLAWKRLSEDGRPEE
jgi:ornithine cyclodeaminase/alanine dehydrogenase-like protein (mu-crystallin family)